MILCVCVCYFRSLTRSAYITLCASKSRELFLQVSYIRDSEFSLLSRTNFEFLTQRRNMGNYSCAITSCGSFAELLNDADSAFDCNRPRSPLEGCNTSLSTRQFENLSVEDAIRLEGRHHVRKE